MLAAVLCVVSVSRFCVNINLEIRRQVTNKVFLFTCFRVISMHNCRCSSKCKRRDFAELVHTNNYYITHT